MSRPRPAPTAAGGSRRSLDGRSVRPCPPASAPPPSARPCPRRSGRMIHIAPPAVACWDVVLCRRPCWSRSLAGRRGSLALSSVTVPDSTDTFAAVVGASALVVGERVSFGSEVGRFGDPLAALGLDVVGPGDAVPVACSAAGLELAGVEPVVDDAGAAAEPAGDLAHADLRGRIGLWCRDLVGVPDPLDRGDIEGSSVAGGQCGGVEPFDKLARGGARAEPADKVDRRGGAASGRAWR